MTSSSNIAKELLDRKDTTSQRTTTSASGDQFGLDNSSVLDAYEYGDDGDVDGQESGSDEYDERLTTSGRKLKEREGAQETHDELSPDAESPYESNKELCGATTKLGTACKRTSPCSLHSSANTHGGRKNRWSVEEHMRFLSCLKTIGRGKWSEMSSVIKTKSPAQIKAHAYRYFKRKVSEKKNCSIHDIHLPDDGHSERHRRSERLELRAMPWKEKTSLYHQGNRLPSGPAPHSDFSHSSFLSSLSPVPEEVPINSASSTVSSLSLSSSHEYDTYFSYTDLQRHQSNTTSIHRRQTFPPNPWYSSLGNQTHTPPFPSTLSMTSPVSFPHAYNISSPLYHNTMTNPDVPGHDLGGYSSAPHQHTLQSSVSPSFSPSFNTHQAPSTTTYYSSSSVNSLPPHDTQLNCNSSSNARWRYFLEHIDDKELWDQILNS